MINDVNNNARFYNIEASRRFGASWVLRAEVRIISAGSSVDPLTSLRHDDIVQFELARHF